VCEIIRLVTSSTKHGGQQAQRQYHVDAAACRRCGLWDRTIPAAVENVVHDQQQKDARTGQLMRRIVQPVVGQRGQQQAGGGASSSRRNRIVLFITCSPPFFGAFEVIESEEVLVVFAPLVARLAAGTCFHSG
jgi:Zn ribbon nucleic-acid-binding protein